MSHDYTGPTLMYQSCASVFFGALLFEDRNVFGVPLWVPYFIAPAKRKKAPAHYWYIQNVHENHTA